jgi:hypothetical protein
MYCRMRRKDYDEATLNIWKQLISLRVVQNCSAVTRELGMNEVGRRETAPVTGGSPPHSEKDTNVLVTTAKDRILDLTPLKGIPSS